MLLMPLVDRFNAVSCLSSVKRGARESKGEKNSIWAFIKGTQEARGARRQLLVITHEWQDKEQFIKRVQREGGGGKILKSMSHPFELFGYLRKGTTLRIYIIKHSPFWMLFYFAHSLTTLKHPLCFWLQPRPKRNYLFRDFFGGCSYIKVGFNAYHFSLMYHYGGVLNVFSDMLWANNI